MTLSFRPYQDSDIDLLQSCIMDWRKQSPEGTYCHPGDIPHRLYNGNMGVVPIGDITRIYYQSDTIAALLLCYPRFGGIDFFINPDFRENYELFVPILEEGYQIVRNYLDNNDKSDKQVYVDCYHRDTARKALLTTAGFYEEENAINLTRRTLDNLPEVKLPEDFSIRSVTIDDAEQLANVHNKSFSPKWTADIYRNKVMLKPGYSPEREFVVVAPDGTFAAFTVTWLDTTNKVGLFEPVGTHEDYRRMGLARALMTYVMHEMRDKGMTEAEVCYATDNPASKALYTGQGFEICHQIYDWKYKQQEEQA